MENKRVVITGMGIISPVGNDIPTFWNNLINGYCGIDYINDFPTENLPVRIAGKIKDFHPEDYDMDKPFVRKHFSQAVTPAPRHRGVVNRTKDF